MVAQLACADCSRLFPTKIGLSQHRRYAHPTQHNADKLSRVKYSGARWSQQESQSLLRLANNLHPSCDTQTALFARLEQYFPGQSAISIKTRLRVLNRQAQQDESSSGGPDQTIGQIAAYSSEADDYSVWFKQTVDCAVSLLESHADSSLASVDLLAFARGLQSGIMTPEQVLSLLDLHASKTFPHTWNPVSRRHRQLVHRICRANYAAIQTLYHQRRKDATSAALDESWKDLANCGVLLDGKSIGNRCFLLQNTWIADRVTLTSKWSMIGPNIQLQARLKEELEASAVELGRAGKKINVRKMKAMLIWWNRKHQATKSNETDTKRLDTYIRQSNRGWMRLLKGTPISYIHTERVFHLTFFRGIQLRCSLYWTKPRNVRPSRGGPMTFCRGNCGHPESLVHVLQSYRITHDARYTRHNRVARKLAKRFRRLGYTVFEELRAPTSTSFIKQ
ncbi:retrovirus-related Pol polyprotein from type-1 retrotransposable element R2 [Clonorchis sinensis]|uniref:Retrovirus-related Pol polyprotein from type-1 retrotransposable element R2 n=1 Tax=Clonorchis sinensis TaxID=79923 RepID=G7YDK5_CLOSI|nr:retrovirus-related Pol polyprotein from type-1 retrotransposable element R2 [Clonorchis sinensis]